MVIVPPAKFFRCVLEFRDKQGFRVRVNSLRTALLRWEWKRQKFVHFGRFSFRWNCKSAVTRLPVRMTNTCYEKCLLNGSNWICSIMANSKSGNIKVVIRKMEISQNAFASSTFRYANSPFRYTNYYTRAVCAVLSTGYFQNRLLTLLFLSTIPKCIFKIQIQFWNLHNDLVEVSYSFFSQNSSFNSLHHDFVLIMIVCK